MIQEDKPGKITPARPGRTVDHDHAHDHSHDDHSHGHGEDGHTDGHNHAHGQVMTRSDGKVSNLFKISLILTAGFVVFQFIAGLMVNSLALISDAGHNLTDAMALAFSWFALVLARRSPDNRKTYGYHRAGILAATLNAATLILISLYVFYEAVQRIFHPEPVEGEVVVIVATVAFLLNGGITLAFVRASKDDLNVRSAFIHLLGDALSSLGVIIAGLIMWFTGLAIFDPLVSILIGLFILWSSWSIIKEATNVLLEGIPEGLDMVSLMHDLMEIPNVNSVHDLHVWTLGGSNRMLSCHILTNETTLHEANTTVHLIKEMLVDKYRIHHATIELECENCEMPELYCTVISGHGAVVNSHD
ncbi:MAG: cation transporter [Chloroflexi bacterium]|nr:cation transporter [Chloroflexota bacterium]